VSAAVRLRRFGYRVAYRALRAWWAVRRPHTRGVKCVLRRDGGDVLFVRHTYGRRGEWELPGGSPRRREPSADTARREAREELGLDLVWTPIGPTETGGDGKTTTLHAFTAQAGDGAGLRITPVEIAEARWAPPTAPPQPLGRDAPAVLTLLARR
jgi:8-oxo-dGTP pyrophosphatase MutT (NUDIX family)